MKRLPYVAYTLVNCFTAAGQLPHAQAIAKQTWALCGNLGSLPVQEFFKDDSDWLNLWHMAELDKNDIVQILLERHPENAGLMEQALRFAVLAWIDPPETVAARCLNWAQIAISAANITQLDQYWREILSALRARGLWREKNQLAGAIWETLGNVHTAEAEQARISLDWDRFDVFGAVESRDWEEAHNLVKAEIKARGVQGAVGGAAIVAGGSGSPTPPEILQALEENGVSEVDEYGMFGWYIVAREAAQGGDLAKAFDALRKALSYWSNTPYWITNLWEKDTYWGSLRDHPEFRQAFDQRRQRIGTIFGMLHYFPSW